MKYPVLLPNIFNYPFTYESEEKFEVGQYVKVPFGRSNKTGLVWDKFEENQKKNYSLKKIICKLNISPLNSKTIKFINWFSEYNLIPAGMSLKLHLLSNEGVENFTHNEYQYYVKQGSKESFKLSAEQQEAYKDIIKKKKYFQGPFIARNNRIRKNFSVF